MLGGDIIGDYFDTNYVEYLETETHDYSKQKLEKKQKEIAQREANELADKVAMQSNESNSNKVIYIVLGITVFAGLTIFALKKKGVI